MVAVQATSKGEQISRRALQNTESKELWYQLVLLVLKDLESMEYRMLE